MIKPKSQATIQVIPDNGLHVVMAGETLYGISFRYGLKVQDLAAWNHVTDPPRIQAGQRLHLRAPDIVSTSSASPSATVKQSVSTTKVPPIKTTPVVASDVPNPISKPAIAIASSEKRPHPSTDSVVAPVPAAPVAVKVPVPAIPTAAPMLPDSPSSPVAGLSWRWPTKGNLVGRFVLGDQTQQGVNIASSAGQDVIAAASGVVVYSGAGLVGYGELIIIKHDDQWLSAYAHNRRRLVTEGSKVNAGDVIAHMGRTGANRDMLHFEIRRNGKPVDPLGLLPNR